MRLPTENRFWLIVILVALVMGAAVFVTLIGFGAILQLMIE